MASGSQNMTTYNARIVTGSNNAASPAGALLLSGAGRADDATGDTWIFLDSNGGLTNPWGIKHDQANNKLQIFGSGTNSFSVSMDTGDTYILGKVGIGYDPETSGNTYKLYVEGSTRINSTLHIFPNSGNYTEGIRIHSYNSWSDITLCGNDNTEDSGISANSWFIGNNNGNFYIARNGSPGSTAWLECVNNIWSTMNPLWIKGGSTEAGADANRLTTTSGMPGNMQYNASRRGTQIYSNGIAFADPYNGNSNSDAGWIRHQETTGNSGELEIAVGDDGNETIVARQYKTDNTINRTLTLLNANGYMLLPSYINVPTNNNENPTVSQFIVTNGSDHYYRKASTAHVANAIDGQHKWVRISGDTMSGTLTFNNANIGISRVGRSTSWIAGRDGALVKVTSISGYSGAISIKTKNGTWVIGAYDHSSYQDKLIFSYGSDSNYNSNNNSTTNICFRNTGVTENAMWNDYAEYRKASIIEPGRVVYETKTQMAITDQRLLPGARVISDTYGFIIGHNNNAETPIAVSGRVLVYPYKDRYSYKLGAAVCSAPNGTVDIMTREEIMKYPERIVGIVSEIPDYDKWQAGGGDTEIDVNGRIWIYVR